MSSALIRPAATVSTAVAVWLATASPASGDLALIFNEARAQPGQKVEAFYGIPKQGTPTPVPRLGQIWAYFVPMTAAKSPRNQRPTGRPTDPRWEPIGRLRRDPSGVPRITFTVPNVPAGDYTVGFWCKPCASPEGATFTGAYPGRLWTGKAFSMILRVYRPTANASIRSHGGSHAIWAVPVLGVVSALAIAFGYLRHRRVSGHKD
jgi:hypothetical protein